MRRLVRALAAAAALVVFTAPTARAQDQAAADEKEIASYRLTMAAVKKFEVAMEALADFASKDPKVQATVKLQAEVDALRKKDELTESEQAKLEKLERQLEEDEGDDGAEMKDDATLTEMAAEIAKQPGVAAAFRRAGMTPREYLVFAFALFQASAYAQMRASGTIRELPKEVNMENVKFAEAHAAELKALEEKAKRIGNQFTGSRSSP